jgi:hypothetical protein
MTAVIVDAALDLITTPIIYGLGTEHPASVGCVIGRPVLAWWAYAAHFHSNSGI